MALFDPKSIYPIPDESRQQPPTHPDPNQVVRADSDAASNMIRMKLAGIDTPPTTQTEAAPPAQPVIDPRQVQHHQTPLNQTINGSVQPEQRSVAEIKQQLLQTVRGAGESRSKRWGPLITALIAGFGFLFISYNEIVIAQVKQYVSPGSSLTTPIIIDPSDPTTIGKDPRILIPKINVDVPVVYDVTTFDEHAIQDGLERGVVHYGTTALPGEIGNNVIVGHSSNNFLNDGKYKFAFVLLDRMKVGDTFILHYKGTRYVYEIYNKQIIEPTDFSLIQPTDKPVATLITCTPPGTSWRRLVVQGRQISPNPAKATESNEVVPDDINTPVPGNAPSFWSRLFN